MINMVPKADAPPPEPPKQSKNDIYHNLTANQVFSDLDEYVVNVSLQKSFTNQTVVTVVYQFLAYWLINIVILSLRNMTFFCTQIAETEQTTFTDLVNDLTGDLMSDLAKAR